MGKVIGIIVLILSILLFPPAVLALVSNNAVPGDAAYPIKRTLEDGIVFLASFNPTTKAWFSVTRSNRRFDEVKTLIAEGKGANETLSELVSQTSVAASEVSKVEDPQKREEIINQLSKSIDKYDTGLGQIAPQAAPQTPPTLTATPALTPEPTNIPTRVPTPSPTAKLPSPSPTATVQPSPSPTPSAAPTTTAQPNPSSDREAIEKARKELEEIRKRLEEEREKPHPEPKESGNKFDNPKKTGKEK